MIISLFLNQISCIFHVKNFLKNHRSTEDTDLPKNEYLLNKIMAHRGLFGYYPEHSIKGFELAFLMGADYLETDINVTKDKQLIVFHDPILDIVTNINEFPEFSNRKTTKTLDGTLFQDNFFISDFTLEELKKLNISQRYKYRPQLYNNEFKIILIEELINFVIENNKKFNKKTGIYIEPKFPAYYYEEINFDVNLELKKLFEKYNLNDLDNKENFNKCPIIIQAFEIDTLKYFKKNANIPQIALMTWRKFYNFTDLALYSDGLGPDVNFILYERMDDLLYANSTKYNSQEDFIKNVSDKIFKEEIEKLGENILPSKKNLFVEYARKLKLHIHPWDLNNDNLKFSINPEIQYCKLKKLGVTGFFADFCDTALFSIKYSNDLCYNL